jgi:hypothetical protein
MSEDNQKNALDKYLSMTMEEKLDFIAKRISGLDFAFGAYVKFNKNEDKFKRFYEKEMKKMRLSAEEAMKAHQEGKAEESRKEEKDRYKARTEKLTNG